MGHVFLIFYLNEQNAESVTVLLLRGHCQNHFHRAMRIQVTQSLKIYNLCPKRTRNEARIYIDDSLSETLRFIN